jgi:hypothetical protein
MYGQRLLYDRTPALEMVQGARITGIEWPAKYLGEWCMGYHDAVYASVPFEIMRLDPPSPENIKMDGTSPTQVTARWRFNVKDKTKGDWLKFEKDEVITNISCKFPAQRLIPAYIPPHLQSTLDPLPFIDICDRPTGPTTAGSGSGAPHVYHLTTANLNTDPYQEFWCWSGTNQKGKWGIFPQAFIDIGTLRDFGVGSDRASVISSEKNKPTGGVLSRFSTRKSGRSGRRSSVAGSVGSNEILPPPTPVPGMYGRE